MSAPSPALGLHDTAGGRATVRGELHVDGGWRSAADGATREVRSPHDDRLVAVVAEAGPADADAAVEAARRAFDEGPWPHTPAAERGRIVSRIADLVAAHAEELAVLEVLDTGKPMADAVQDMADVEAVFRYYGGLAPAAGGRTVEPPSPDVESVVHREPVGVAALITPWNYPLLQVSWKVAPALAAGCTTVLKPPELTPLTSLKLAELVATHTDLPPGVLNVLTGAGSTVGARLVEHPGVDMVSFTGGLTTGKRIMASAAETVKKVALELGGKNPNLVFPDVDLDIAVDHAATGAFLHSGQVCSAGARVLVHESVAADFVDRLVAKVGQIRMGDGFDDGVITGPLVSREHRDKVAGYVDGARTEGAVVRCGGRVPDDPALAEGWYYEPTVLDRCTADMTVVQEEVFGPVVTIETFTDEDEAVRLANATVYGLAGAVWTNDAGRARRVARALRMGTVWINDFHPYVPQAEWGGFKQSGNGRELGPTGLEEYTETKHVYHSLTPKKAGWIGDGPADKGASA